MEETKKVIVHEKDPEVKASADIWKYVFGFVDMAVVKCAIELKIAEAIENHENQPVTLTELSSIVSCSPSLLYRIMRFLAHQGIFKEQPVKHGFIGYTNTPLSNRLIKHGENSMTALILLESSPVMLLPWHKLSQMVSTNYILPFDAAHDKDLWAYAAENPGHSELFNEAMACIARLVVPAIVEGCGEVFDGISSLADVGGGNGTALGILVKAFPWIKGINFDLPHVVNVAKKFDGVENMDGDMFVSVPRADAVFLMVLHDWDDEDCIKILKKCREAIPEEKGKVIIVDAVVGEEREDDKLEKVRLMLDMVMMAHTSRGKERTLKEWDCILKEAGFKRHDVRHIKAVHSVIVACPSSQEEM